MRWRKTIVSSLCIAAFAACSRAAGLPFARQQGPGPFGFPLVEPAQYRVMYSFGASKSDGARPYAGIIELKNRLYGTTAQGGSAKCTGGCGTVFVLDSSGSERVIYSFGSYAGDGRLPYAALTDVNGLLYGTTRSGGSSTACESGCGSLFSVTATGDEKTVYSFGSYKGDGVSPRAGLVNLAGTLYGTTQKGGAHDRGTVFSLSASGAERVVYSFGSYKHDGLYPVAGLIAFRGILFGTTELGGADNAGMIFRLTTDGAERVLHNFGAGTDGAFPRGGLLLANGNLYGTTSSGGTHDEGAIFISTLTGIEGVLHSFGGRDDGKSPQAALAALHANFYGTTIHGGASGRGVIFSITTSGKERVLHSFDGNGGALPYAGLTNVAGTLYGTTAAGGSGSACGGAEQSGCGVAYTLKP